MTKLERNIQRINFDAPVSYGQAERLADAVNSLPNWSEGGRNQKNFQVSWERILNKVRSLSELTKRELHKVILCVDLVPVELIPNLDLLILNSNHDLAYIARQLNDDFSNLAPLSYLLRVELSEWVETKLFLNGINKYSPSIVSKGWSGLVESIISSSSDYELLVSDFCPNRRIEDLNNSFVKLIQALVESDRDARMFNLNALSFARVLHLYRPDIVNLIRILDDYLGRFIAVEHSWEGRVVSDEYSAVQLLSFFMNDLQLSLDELPTFARKVYEQRNNLQTAIEMLNRQEPDRGNFWRVYMPTASRVIPKRSADVVAVAFFFGDIVIVEFAPAGNAAYVYKRDVFESEIMNRQSALSWKDKKNTLVIRGFTREDGTLYHIQDWQSTFRAGLDGITRKKHV